MKISLLLLSLVSSQIVNSGTTLIYLEKITDPIFSNPVHPQINFQETILDAQKNLYVSTKNRGLYEKIFGEKNFKHFDIYVHKDPVVNVGAVLKDSSKNLWLPTLYHGVLKQKFNSTEFVQIPLNDAQHTKEYQASKLIEDFDHNIWMIGSDGLFKFNEKNNVFDKFESGIKPEDNHSIMDIYQDGKNNLWVSILTRGVYVKYYGQNNFNKIEQIPGKIQYFSKIFEANNLVYLSTAVDGLFVSNDFKSFKHVDTYGKFDVNTISSVGNMILLGTNHNGLWIGNINTQFARINDVKASQICSINKINDTEFYVAEGISGLNLMKIFLL